MKDEEIKQIWDGFGPDRQNMPKAEFFREMRDLTDQTKIQEDLREIELMKARQRCNKIRIDKELNDANAERGFN